LAVAPVGSVLLAVAVGADFAAVEDLAGAGVAAAAAGVAAAAAGVAAAAAGAAAAGAAEVPAFWTPPWPLQVPLPVDVEVVPSLQVLGVESAQAGSDSANIIKGAAMSPTSSVFFMNVHSRV
jgi:hypothetical protein